MTHSPEPWGYKADGPPVDDPDGYCEIFARADAKFGQYITVVATWVSEDGDAAYGIRQVDARRIVACVNELAGVPDAILKSGAVKKLLDELLRNDIPLVVDGPSPEAEMLQAFLNFQREKNP